MREKAEQGHWPTVAHGTMTLTRLVLLVMLVAVFVIAGRMWWALRSAKRKRPRHGRDSQRFRPPSRA